jgi:hypothetical protein
VALITTGCAPGMQANSDYQTGLDFGRYSTFAWDEDAIRETGDVRLENNPFFQDRLFEAVARELSARGIRRDDSSPDLLVHYHLSVVDHIEVFETNPESGYPDSEYGPGTDIIQYEQGTFIVHLVDAETGENLWIGWAQGKIESALNDSVKMREWVDEAVGMMFDDFPVLTERGS